MTVVAIQPCVRVGSARFVCCVRHDAASARPQRLLKRAESEMTVSAVRAGWSALALFVFELAGVAITEGIAEDSETASSKMEDFAGNALFNTSGVIDPGCVSLTDESWTVEREAVIAVILHLAVS